MADSQAPSRRNMTYFGMFVMVLGGVAGGITQTSMNTLLPSTAADFGISVAMGQWLVTVFTLSLGISMPVVASLSRKYDARSLYLASAALFMAGTVAVAAAPNFLVAIAGRIMQGCATGLVFPLLQVVTFAEFPPERFGTIMGFIGLAFGFAPNIGPTVAGAFETAWGWRSFYWAMLCFEAVVFVLTLVAVPKGSGGKQAGMKMDFASLLLSTLGFGGLLMGCSNASTYGFASVATWGALAVGVVFTAVFVRRQLHLEHPFLDMRVFAYRDMTAGTVAVCLLFMAFIGMALVIPLELQELHGFSAFWAGVAMLPGVVTALVMNPVSGMLLDRYGPRGICLFGSASLVAGTAAMFHLGQLDSLPLVMVLQGIRTLGISSLIMPLSTWSVAALPVELSPDGSAVSNALRQVMASLGTAVMVLLMSGGAAGGSVTAAGVDHATWFSLAIALAMGIICLLFVKPDSQQEGRGNGQAQAPLADAK